MFIPAILFWLLCRLPDFPPPPGDVGMFPPASHVKQALARYDRHLDWVRHQSELAANDVERLAWAGYATQCQERALPWRTLELVHRWAGPPMRIKQADLRGVLVDDEDVVRDYLRQLRDQLGPVAYYGGCLPVLPQWPRIEAQSSSVETVPLPAAGGDG